MSHIVHHHHDVRGHHGYVSPALVLKAVALAVLTVAWVLAARDAVSMLGLHAIVDTFGTLADVAAKPAPAELDSIVMRLTIYFTLYVGPALFLIVALI